MKPVLCIVGTRPNYVKVAPLLVAFDTHVPAIPYKLVHTGQHYDTAMEKVFFDSLSMPTPDVNLGAGPGTHAVQTARIMERLDPVIDAIDPGCVLVVGDVNSTLAAALVAAKRNLPLIHVESGLRSGDRTMPEEVNRIVTDALADLLFTTERGASANLTREGIPSEKIRFVGNVMIDTLDAFRDRFVKARDTLRQGGCQDPDQWVSEGYVLATLHRPSNVDTPEALGRLLTTLDTIARTHRVVFPMHPRTRGNLARFGLSRLVDSPRWLILDPLPYFDMLGMMQEAAAVLTDSGGVQEETSVLGVPCLTLRDNTERPVTVEQGTNQLIGTRPENILEAFEGLRAAGILAARDRRTAKRPELWDGQAARRIAAAIWERRNDFLAAGRSAL